MPREWMHEYVGDEARPRAGFEEELAGTLTRAWQGEPQRHRLRAALAVAAAVAVVVGAVALLTGRDDGQVLPADTTPHSVSTSNSTSGIPPAGSPYIAIGDSVMVGVQQELRDAGVVVDTGLDRDTSGVIAAIDESVGHTLGSTSTVLIQVGMNAPLTEGDLEAVLDAVPTYVDRVVFMTVAAPVLYVDENNALIRALPTVDARVTVADWAEASKDVVLCDDRVHVTCSDEAKQFYVDFVLAAFGIDVVPPTTVDTTETTVDPAFPDGMARPAKEYFSALAGGDYLAAAKLLGEGGLEWTARADLRPLYRPEFGMRPEDVSNEALAAALERWCATAACGSSITSITDVGDGWFSVAMSDAPVFSLVRVTQFEGQPAVRGLPMQGIVADRPERVTLCPTDHLDRTAWADLDGDGWMELLVAQRFPVEGDPGMFNFDISSCGSPLTFETPFPLTAIPDLFLSVVNPTGSGSDFVLAGRNTPTQAGTIFRYNEGGLTEAGGTFEFSPPDGTGRGTSLSCVTTADGSGPLLANVIYLSASGGDLSKPGTVQYDVTNALVPDEQLERGFLTLPDQQQQAFELINGTCNGLPIVTP